jgi:hypothetical protein
MLLRSFGSKCLNYHEVEPDEAVLPGHLPTLEFSEVCSTQ